MSEPDPGAPPTADSRGRAVEARGLGFDYGERNALDDLSFAVEPGEIFGFLGPNGGGKTTLFRILATLLRPARGSVRVFGSDVTEEAALVRLQLGVAFQSPSLDAQLTVEENLRHQARLYGMRGREAGRQIDLQLERFGLAGRRRNRAGELSGGLRRRVEVAKALLHRPRLLLLDEPGTGLDPGARREVWAALEELRTSRGVTVLLTTHFMEEGDRCDRLALIDRGRLVATGRPGELKSEIGGDVVTLKVRDAETLGRKIEHRFDVGVAIAGEEIRFEHAGGHELLARLAESFPGEIEAATVSKPTLEDVFLQRTGHRLEEAG